MRLHLKNISPEVHGMIAQHKASHEHTNLDETVSCLVKESMQEFDYKDRYADQTALIRFHIAEIDRLKTKLCELRTENDKLRMGLQAKDIEMETML